MAAIEMVSGFATAPGATLTAVTFASGQSGTVRNFQQGRNAHLIQAWTKQNTTLGILRLRSPRMHDATNGLSWQQINDNAQPLFGYGFSEPLVAQDTIITEVSGSAVAGDIISASFMIYYESLDSSNARFADMKEVETRRVHRLTVRQSITAGVTGGLSGSQAWSAAASGDLLKANTDYALLGYTVQATAAGCCSVAFQGVDTGNLVIGGPALPNDNEVTADWFATLCKRYGVKMIPIINSANKGGTTTQVVNDENANTVVVSLNLVELA